MAWTDTEERVRHEFDTRWSGTMERNGGDDGAEGGRTDGDPPDDDTPAWQFTGMHVSTSVEGR
jgi:hypothetical protein